MVVGVCGGSQLGGTPALRDRLAFHPGRLPPLPKACFCPAALNSDRSALQTCWFLADPVHWPRRAPRRVHALFMCGEVSFSLSRSRRKKGGCNYCCCLQDPSACLFLFASVFPLRLNPLRLIPTCFARSGVPTSLITCLRPNSLHLHSTDFPSFRMELQGQSQPMVISLLLLYNRLITFKQKAF